MRFRQLRKQAPFGELFVFGCVHSCVHEVQLSPQYSLLCASCAVFFPPQGATRPYADHHEYCLFFNGGKCSKCIERCPVGAVTEDGHDKVKCRAYLDVTLKYVKDCFGLETYACVLCQTGVPCESGIPREGASG